MIKAIIFDMDGLLGDTEPAHFKAWKKTLAGYDGDMEFDDFKKYIGTNDEKVAMDYIIRLRIEKTVEELVKEKKSAFFKAIPNVKLMDGARDAIERFKQDYIFGIASSSNEKEVTEILRVNGILDLFKAILCGDMVKNKKPSPEIYLKTCELLNLKPSECLALEDSSHGIAAAKKGGLFSVAVPHEYTNHHDFSEADIILSSLNELDQNIIKKIGEGKCAE